MCRLAAYLGKPLSLKDFLIKPEHSLYLQSWAPKELQYAKLNADGFGFGWYQNDGTTAAYRNAMPIWSDTNLEGLATALKRDLWIAMVRSATEGFASNIHNSQPFRDQSRLCVHNGMIKNFRHRLRHEILKILDPDIESGVCGLTDSEYLFALIRQYLDKNPRDSVADTLQKVWHWLHERIKHGALLNFIISEADTLFAMRASIKGPSLTMYSYYHEGSHIIASERMTDSEKWKTVPENSILILQRNEPPSIIKI